MEILGRKTKKEMKQTNQNDNKEPGKTTESVSKKSKDKKPEKKKKTNNKVKSADNIRQKKNKKVQDIHKMTIIRGIHDNLIDYGSYFGAVIEIPSIEFRFFSQHRRNNSIDVALANVIRSVGARYSANLVKIERPLMMDQYIETEMNKIEMLKKIMLQNKKIINQNKIIIDLLKKQGETDD